MDNAKYLNEKGMLSPVKYLKISLKYFKYEELQNIHKGIKEKGWELNTARERFQLFKDPVVESYEKFDERQKRVDSRW